MAFSVQNTGLVRSTHWQVAPDLGFGLAGAFGLSPADSLLGMAVVEYWEADCCSWVGSDCRGHDLMVGCWVVLCEWCGVAGELVDDQVSIEMFLEHFAGQVNKEGVNMGHCSLVVLLHWKYQIDWSPKCRKMKSIILQVCTLSGQLSIKKIICIISWKIN